MTSEWELWQASLSRRKEIGRRFLATTARLRGDVGIFRMWRFNRDVEKAIDSAWEVSFSDDYYAAKEALA